MGGLAVLIQVDDGIGAVGEVGTGLGAVAHAAGGGHAGDEHVVAGALGGVGVHHVAVLVQHQSVGLVQIVVQGIRVGLQDGLKGAVVVVAGAVHSDAGALGVGGHVAVHGVGQGDVLDLAGGHGEQHIVAVGEGVQVVEVLVIDGEIRGGHGGAVQGVQIQLAVGGVVVALHLGHIGVDHGDGHVVVIVVHKDLGEHAVAGALITDQIAGAVPHAGGVVAVAGDEVAQVVIRSVHFLAVHIYVQIGGTVVQITVDRAAHRIIELAGLGGGGEGGVGGLGEGADLGAAVQPGHGGALEAVLAGLVLGQIREVVLAELLHLVAVRRATVVVVLVGGDGVGGAGDDHGAAVGSGDGGGAAAGVGHHVGLQGLEGHLGGVLTGDHVGQHQAGGADARVHGVGGHVDGPVGAHIALGVGIVAQGHQAHLGEGQAGQLALGIEGAVAGAGQDALLGTVADVAGRPAVGGHVAEHHGVGGQLLGVLAQEHAADDRRGLLTGQGAVGIEGAAVGALEYTEGRHDLGRLDVGDFIRIGEITGTRSAGPDNHHANQHGGRQKQAESPFEVSHLGFPPSKI